MQWAEYVSNLTKKYKNNQNEYDLLDRLENTLTTDGFPTIGSIITSRLIIIVFEDYIIPPIPILKGWNRIIFNNRWYYTFNHKNYKENIKDTLKKMLEIFSNKYNEKYLFYFF